MDLGALLKEFAARNQLEDLGRRRDGSYTLVFDGRYKVRLVPDGTAGTVLVGRAGTLPEDERRRQTVLENVLQTAAGRMRTGHETVALEPTGDTLVVHQRLPADMSLPDFEAALGDFVNALARWQGVLNRPETTGMAVPPFHSILMR